MVVFLFTTVKNVSIVVINHVELSDTLKKNIAYFISLAGLLASPAALADLFDKNYIALSPMYSDVQATHSKKEVGFNLSFGTEIHKQWYAELGVNYFSSGFDNLTQPTDLDTAFAADSGIDASGVHLAFLGKAKNQRGELYYRIGIAALNVTSEKYVTPESSCGSASRIETMALDGAAVSLCSMDDTKLAGMIGIGFDTYLGYETQLRFAIDHYRGQDDIQINTIQLGLRYNF